MRDVEDRMSDKSPKSQQSLLLAVSVGALDRPENCRGACEDSDTRYVLRVDRSDEESVGWVLDLCGRIVDLVDEYRTSLHDCLDGLTEDEARLRLVLSKTTLLGLVKHVTYVEGVWFDQAVTGRTSIEAGIASTPDQSFTIAASDTIASVQASYRRRCDTSRRTMADLGLDERVSGRGDRPVWALHIQVLRELAQHAGHADILREQVLTRRTQQRPNQ